MDAALYQAGYRDVAADDTPGEPDPRPEDTPETPLDEPPPPRVQDPPSEPEERGPYVVRVDPGVVSWYASGQKMKTEEPS